MRRTLIVHIESDAHANQGAFAVVALSTAFIGCVARVAGFIRVSSERPAVTLRYFT